MYDNLNMSKMNSVAIVTGGSKGLGLSIAKSLLDSNYKVVIGSRTIPDEVLDRQNCIHVKGDLSEFKAHQKLVDVAISEFGSLNGFCSAFSFAKISARSDLIMPLSLTRAHHRSKSLGFIFRDDRPCMAAD